MQSGGSTLSHIDQDDIHQLLATWCVGWDVRVCAYHIYIYIPCYVIGLSTCRPPAGEMLSFHLDLGSPTR